MAGASGLADYPFAIIPHPIAGNSDEALREERNQGLDGPLRLVAELLVGIAGDRVSDHGERVVRETVRFGHGSRAGDESVGDHGHGRHAELLG